MNLVKIIYTGKKADKKILKRINNLLKNISRKPFDEIEKSEPVKLDIKDFAQGELMETID